MRNIMLAGILLMCVTTVVGCVTPPITAPVVPPPGVIFTQYTAPLMTDFEYTETADARRGTASARYLMIPIVQNWISFTWGDASIDAAARNGNLSAINSADYQYLSVLGIYAELKVMTYGE